MRHFPCLPVQWAAPPRPTLISLRTPLLPGRFPAGRCSAWGGSTCVRATEADQHWAREERCICCVTGSDVRPSYASRQQIRPCCTHALWCGDGVGLELTTTAVEVLESRALSSPASHSATSAPHGAAPALLSVGIFLRDTSAMPSWFAVLVVGNDLCYACPMFLPPFPCRSTPSILRYRAMC